MERKLTTPFVVAALAVAFVAVSAWVWFSRGRNARAIRTKFKIGGLLLTLTTAVTTQSCKHFVTCYDPEPQPYYYLANKCDSLVNGDTLRLGGYLEYSYFSYEVLAEDGKSLQKDCFSRDNSHWFKDVFEVGDYVGKAKINVYGEQTEGEIKQEKLVESFDVTIVAAPTKEEDDADQAESDDVE